VGVPQIDASKGVSSPPPRGRNESVLPTNVGDMQPWWQTALQYVLAGLFGVVLGAYLNHRFAVSRSNHDTQRTNERDSLHRLDDQLQQIRKQLEPMKPGPPWEEFQKLLTLAPWLPAAAAVGDVNLPHDGRTTASHIAQPVRQVLCALQEAPPSGVSGQVYAAIRVVDQQRELIRARLADPRVAITSES